MRTDLLRWLCPAFLTIAVSGCARPEFAVSIKSNKLVAYHPAIQRLLVVTDLGAALKMLVYEDEDTAFESSFTDSLGNCGIAVNFRRHDPLALQNEAQEAIKSFHPDTVMTIQWRSGAAVGPLPASFSLEGSIIDLRSKTQVWKAEIDTSGGAHAGKHLAATLIENLKMQSVLGPACVPPVVPKS